MQPADFFTYVSVMVPCNTPEFFNARIEGQYATKLGGRGRLWENF